MSLEISDETTFLLDMVNQTYIAQYQTVYDSLTTKPGASVADAQNTMVSSLVSAGIWAKMDLFYLFAQATNGASEALLNWINPGTFDGTLVNAPAFVALEGFTGGTDEYIDTDYMPESEGIKYLKDDASFGCYIRTDTDGIKTDMGVQRAGELIIMQSRSSNSFNHAINDDTVASGANTDSRGFYINSRDSSTVTKGYKNGSVVISGAVTSTDIPNSYNLYILCTNNQITPTNFSDRQLSIAFAGGKLDQTEVTAFTNAVEAYMDSNSKGVIS